MRRFVLALILPLLAFVALSGPVRAERARPSDDEIRQAMNSLHFADGTIDLQNGLATIALTPAFRFLNAHDTQTLLTTLWGNPPTAAEGALGAIVPAGTSVMAADSWAVIVGYEAAGHVSDDDAAGIDYDALLRDMQQATEDHNKDRVDQGYQPLHLVGWARAPHYDPTTKKLYWAKRLRLADDPAEALNYEIRVLGRRGYLVLDIIAGMDNFGTVDRQTDTILSMVQFNQGNTYGEFDAKLDDTAAYGIAGLIAGGVLAKAGFFKGLIALVIAFKKVILVGLAAVVIASRRWIGRLFGRGGGGSV